MADRHSHADVVSTRWLVTVEVEADDPALAKHVARETLDAAFEVQIEEPTARVRMRMTPSMSPDYGPPEVDIR